MQFVILEKGGGDLYELQFAFLSHAHPFTGSHNHSNKVPVMDLPMPNQARLGYINNPFYRKGGEKD